MSEEERYKKYVKEHCINCKNKTKYLCDIRIWKKGDITITKCDYYEKEYEL